MRALIAISIFGVVGLFLFIFEIVIEKQDGPSRNEGAQSPITSAAETPSKIQEPPRRTFVVLDESGDPVVGARVWAGPSRFGHMSMYSSAVPLPNEGECTSHRTDEKGRVQVEPSPTERLSICTEYKGHMAIGSIEPATRRITHRDQPKRLRPLPTILKLTKVRRFEITLMNQDGSPIPDALVAIVGADRNDVPVPANKMHGVTSLPHGQTNAEGRLVFLARPNGATWPLMKAEQIDVIVPRFGGESTTKRVAVSGEMTRITVAISQPATMRIERDASDSDKARAGLFLNSGAQSHFPVGRMHRETCSVRKTDFPKLKNSAYFTVSNPGFRLANFEPGAEVSVSRGVSKFTALHTTHRVGTAGEVGILTVPHSKRSDVTVRSTPTAKIRFRIRDPEGNKMVTEASPSIHVTYGHRLLNWEIERDSKNGDFVIVVPTKIPCCVQIHDPFRLGGGRNPNLRDQPSHTFAVHSLDEGSDHDLGTVEFYQPTLIAKGQVVDSSNKPLREVRVLATQAAFGSIPRSEFETTTDDKGFFALYGRTRKGRPFILSSLSQMQFAPRSIVQGEENIKVLAGPGGFISGWIELPRFSVTNKIKLTARREGNLSVPRSVVLNPNGLFMAQDLPSGRYTFVIEMSRQEVRRINNIEVVNVQASRPDALQGIEIDYARHVQEVSVCWPNGDLAKRARVSCSGKFRGKSFRENEMTDTDGIARFFVPRDGTYEIKINEYRRVKPPRNALFYSNSNASLPLAVRLSDRPRIELAFSRPFPAREGQRWQIRIDTKNAMGIWKPIGLFIVRRNETQTHRDLPLRWEGPCRLYLVEAKPTENDDRNRMKDDFFIGEFDIPFVGDQSISIDLDADLEARIVEFQRDHAR